MMTITARFGLSKPALPGLKSAMWPILLIMGIQLVVATGSIQILSTSRSLVAAESIWAKGYKDSVHYLTHYLQNREGEYLRAYDAALSIPLTASRARLVIEADRPDPKRAQDFLVEAGNSPEDVAGMVRILRYGRGFHHIDLALEYWRRADALILELDHLATKIRTGGGGSAANRTAVEWMAEIEAVNAEIAPVAAAFSESISEGGRFIERLLSIVNVALALGLLALTTWRVRRFLAQRQKIESDLSWQAAHDSLTGIANRRALEMRLNEATATGSLQALMFLDLDQFKIVNDTSGHAAGDKLLRQVCAPLQGALRSGDLLARLGGDEFGILLVDGPPERAVAVAEALRAAVQALDFVWNGRAFQITASIGLLHIGRGAATTEEMMRAADMACFMAKEKGRNRVHVHLDADRDLLRHADEMNWVQRIHHALKEDRFCLYAQEIVPLAGAPEEGMHLELLIRLRDEAGGLVPPGSFLPAAERFGLMGLIDRWVVKTAFRTLAARRANAGAEPIACCAINLSGTTLGDESFVGFVEEALAEYHLPHSIICFEITETSAVTNLDTAAAFIRRLQSCGCRFSLDDFGSGMSSFGYLKHLPVDFLKIDGGFVRNLLSDDIDQAMVVSINHIGHVMGKHIIAEFVETDALAAALKIIGVDYGQGYGIAKPKPFDATFRAEGVVVDTSPARNVA